MPDAPVPPPAGVPVTKELVQAFLALRTTQARIRQIAGSRLGKGASPADVDDVVQLTCERALRAEDLPDEPAKLRPWISRITATSSIDFMRRTAAYHARFRGEVDVEQMPPDPIDAVDDEPSESAPLEDAKDASAAASDRGLIGPWIDEKVAHRPGDALMVEMFRYKARHSVTDGQLAATFGLSLEAYESRLRRFRARYVPMRRRHVRRRNALLILLLLAAVLFVILLALWLPPRRPDTPIGPDRFVTPPPPTSAPSSTDDSRFNQAAPTDGGAKPELKP
jgi:DNA-directed RNA polymerase specialized sigma24 family protein